MGIIQSLKISMLARNAMKTFRSVKSVNPAIAQQRSFSCNGEPPKRVLVSGAAGQIAYSIVYRIASGEFLGKDQRIILHLLDLPF